MLCLSPMLVLALPPDRVEVLGAGVSRAVAGVTG
jgi:hypothetical protein